MFPITSWGINDLLQLYVLRKAVMNISPAYLDFEIYVFYRYEMRRRFSRVGVNYKFVDTDAVKFS